MYVNLKTKPKADKRPTWTALVLKALVDADDFMNLSQIMEVTKATSRQASAAVCHLQKYKVIESVVGNDHKLWWFATPEYDSRLRHLEERVPEEKGNRTRRKVGMSRGKVIQLPTVSQFGTLPEGESK